MKRILIFSDVQHNKLYMHDTGGPKIEDRSAHVGSVQRTSFPSNFKRSIRNN